MGSVFTRIIARELPSFQLYENEYVLAFLSIDPVQPGHTLIVPKIEVDYFVDVPEPYYSAVFVAAKHIAPALQQATNTPRVGTMIIGTDVPHFHYHLIPFTTARDLDLHNANRASSEQLAAIQQKILTFL